MTLESLLENNLSLWTLLRKVVPVAEEKQRPKRTVKRKDEKDVTLSTNFFSCEGIMISSVWTTVCVFQTLIGDTENLIASITMPETKSDCDANSCAEPPDKDGDDASEFVEVDPTGRYGRVGTPTLSLAWIIFSWTVFPESLRVFHALYAYLLQWNMFHKDCCVETEVFCQSFPGIDSYDFLDRIFSGTEEWYFSHFCVAW